MLTPALSILLAIFQAAQTGTLVGLVTIPGNGQPLQEARLTLLPPKYTELWNKQAQTRLDNYWEIFKPEFAANKEHFAEFDRMAQIEAFRSVASTMRRDLGEAVATRLIKNSSSSGQFEFNGVPFDTYQLIVVATVNGRDVIWSKSIDVHTDIPIFVDLGKPLS